MTRRSSHQGECRLTNSTTTPTAAPGDTSTTLSKPEMLPQGRWRKVDESHLERTAPYRKKLHGLGEGERGRSHFFGQISLKQLARYLLATIPVFPQKHFSGSVCTVRVRTRATPHSVAANDHTDVWPSCDSVVDSEP